MNEIHQNGLCPRGDDIWCTFKNRAVQDFACQYKQSLLAAVMDAIKTVLKNFFSADLLKRYLYGTTHNPNEGVNSVIWTRIPKRLDTPKFGVYDAVLCFINVDAAKNSAVLNTLVVRSRSNTVNALKEKIAKLNITREAKKKQKDTEKKIKRVHMIYYMVLGSNKHESVWLFTAIFVMLKL